MFFLSPSSQDWGGEGQGLAEASAHSWGERRVPGQRGLLLGDVAFAQPLTCHCLPGANQLPPQSGGPQNHSASDQEEMAGLVRRPGHSVSLDFFKCGWSPQGHKFSRENVTHFHILSHVKNWVAGFRRPAPIKVLFSPECLLSVQPPCFLLWKSVVRVPELNKDLRQMKLLPCHPAVLDPASGASCGVQGPLCFKYISQSQSHPCSSC